MPDSSEGAPDSRNLDLIAAEKECFFALVVALGIKAVIVRTADENKSCLEDRRRLVPSFKSAEELTVELVSTLAWHLILLQLGRDRVLEKKLFTEDGQLVLKGAWHCVRCGRVSARLALFRHRAGAERV